MIQLECKRCGVKHDLWVECELQLEAGHPIIFFQDYNYEYLRCECGSDFIKHEGYNNKIDYNERKLFIKKRHKIQFGGLNQYMEIYKANGDFVIETESSSNRYKQKDVPITIIAQSTGKFLMTITNINKHPLELKVLSSL